MTMEGLGDFATVDSWERADGAPWPPGAVWLPGEEAWAFALYSRHATAVELLLFREEAPGEPVATVRLDPLRNRTGRMWHVTVPAATARDATLYAYRVDGPWDPATGHRFDREKVLLDPFATRVWFPPGYDRAAAARPGSTMGRAPLAVLPPRTDPPQPPPDEARPRHAHDLVVYELHVRGFTMHPSSGVAAARRGTFAGLVEKIPYLQELGVTAVELLPVQQADPQEGSYWGYMTLGFFAPHAAYAGGDDPADEFRAMVRAFHVAGIEVWLDVVYNHTSEGSEAGPTHSFRGIDNRSYYLLAPDGSYVDDSGCGNTLRTGHPAVRALVGRSLAHWADRFGVDGFRFDLASVLTRTADGRVDPDPSLIAEIGVLAGDRDLRLVAEAWDIGAYQLGRGFPGITWRQWNGRFRDDVRSFVKGDPGLAGALMSRVYGSADLFPDGLPDAYRPWMSVNFVTAHDGFCLWDLVSYDHKHNEANGHGNTDGSDDNRSWNHGWEGDAGAPDDVLALRRRQVRNFAALLLLANGTPMLVAGDEFGHSQGGNNNPYNQDNATTWLDWSRLAANVDLFRFWRLMIAFRKAHPTLGRSRYWRDDVRWHGMEGAVDLGPESRAVAWCLDGRGVGDDDLYVMVNAGWEPAEFRIAEHGPWRRVLDTSLASPADIAEPGDEAALGEKGYRVGPRSVVLLLRRAGERPA
jgi:glycogen operon protein